MSVTSLTQNELLTLFQSLYSAGTEKELNKFIQKHPEIFEKTNNWKPLGNSENFFGVIENQQASPIAALIEKVTNSIDATMMKKCLEAGIDPKSKAAPRSISEAVNQFFPESVDWDLKEIRKNQSENIQVIADGTPRNTSVIIYDNGEGQHPENFENTFLSLLQGNKNEIHFVQGKYNMGGSGAIVFCGDHGYQLIASRRHDGTGEFGFTLIRRHPLNKTEKKKKKNTWYEYLVLDKKIPSFPITRLDLGLHNRAFETGTIVKLYSYQFPPGYSGFAQDLRQSINEFLFEPALPILTVDNAKRYPKNKYLVGDLYGLKRRLNKLEEYIEDSFVDEFEDELFGENGKITCTTYLFKSRVGKFDPKKTRENIQANFFKNQMSVLFSLNGQVHGHFRSEFFARAKLNLLKNHLLVHVDCTNIDIDFRGSLFMASRDRLKKGKETEALRSFLREKLAGPGSRLQKIQKNRKDSIGANSESTQELIKNFTKSLPLSNELLKLLGQTFKIEEEKQKVPKPKPNKKRPEPEPFQPKRFPTFLKIKGQKDPDSDLTQVPQKGTRTLRFETDVENKYFSRTEEAGEFKMALLDYVPNDSAGGTGPGKPSSVKDIFNVHTSSPENGTIKVSLGPQKDTQAGDRVKIKASLTGAGKDFEATFWVKIADPEKPKEKPTQKEEAEELPGLPPPVLVYQEKKEDNASWEDMERLNTSFDIQTVMFPEVSDEQLERIFINMDSRVLKEFKAKTKNPTEEQLQAAERKYISSVYFHTLFLYTITKNRKYRIYQREEGRDEPNEVALEDYLKDVFKTYYSEFVLNFGDMEVLMVGLGD